MKVFVLAIVGLFLGALAGAAVGVGLGMLWTTAFNTSGFEGYSSMLVFFWVHAHGGDRGRNRRRRPLGQAGRRFERRKVNPEIHRRLANHTVRLNSRFAGEV